MQLFDSFLKWLQNEEAVSKLQSLRSQLIDLENQKAQLTFFKNPKKTTQINKQIKELQKDIKKQEQSVNSRKGLIICVIPLVVLLTFMFIMSGVEKNRNSEGNNSSITKEQIVASESEISDLFQEESILEEQSDSITKDIQVSQESSLLTVESEPFETSLIIEADSTTNDNTEESQESEITQENSVEETNDIEDSEVITESAEISENQEKFLVDEESSYINEESDEELVTTETSEKEENSDIEESEIILESSEITETANSES